MNKKLLSVAIAALTLTAACQTDYFDAPTTATQTPTSGTLSRSSNSYFPDGWQYLETNEERYAALQLPDDMLSTMSTGELVEACMSYPLALDCFAYNDVEQGINSVISRFNGFAELKQRDDAFDKVLDFYSRKLDEIATLGGSIGYVFKPLRLSFYERFIISGYLCTKSHIAHSEKLQDLYTKAETVHELFEELKGELSSESLELMADLLKLSKLSRHYYSEITVTIHTRGGLPIIARLRDCKDQAADIAEAKKDIQDYYPNAVIVGDGTCTYNCHAYAWWVSEGGEKYWINNIDDGVNNLSNFISDGTYQQTSTPVNGDKVLYLSDDHSAIVYSNDTFISKWGRSALVRHKYNYGPYNYSDLRYYRKQEVLKIGKVYWDMDPQITPLNTYEDFHINDYYDSTSYRIDIFISSTKEPEEPITDNSKAYIMSSTNQTARVYFASRGIYHVCFFIYNRSTGKCVGKYTSEEVYAGY